MIIKIEDRPKINQFIQKVFNYYNGRINIFNYPAKLRIDWLERRDSDIGGLSRNPNVVTIYPNVTARFVQDGLWLQYNLIVCVIHELFHTDQNLCYQLYLHDKRYHDIIESTVEINTYLYIANNHNELYREFGIVDRIPYNQYYTDIAPKFETGQLYQRRDYYTHCISLLQDIIFCVKDPIIDSFTKAFMNEDSKIDIRLNNLLFTLKDGKYCMPISQLNDIMEQEFFQYILRKSDVVSRSYTKNNMLKIEIDTDCSNFMGRIVNQ